MKKLSIAVVSLSAVALGAFAAAAPAAAADMALKAPPVPMAYSWAGWYLGANLGGSFGQARDTVTFAGVGNPASNPRLDGVIGGGQIGYNWQSGAWVWGLEADIQGSSQRGSGNSSATGVGGGFGVGVFPVTGTFAYTERLPWFGTVRGRLGFTVTPTTLLYATGGLAYGEVRTSESLTEGALVTGGNFNTTRAGWTVGAGLETLLGGNWTGKIEYLYVDLGSIGSSFAAASPPFTAAFTPISLNSHVTDNILRVGVNYHFNGPMSGRY